MKTRLLPFLCILALVVGSRGEQIAIPDTGITFDAPEGFTALTKEEIGLKYPRGKAPGFVVGNARRTTTIAYELKPNPIPQERLAEVKEAFEKVFEGVVRGLVWKERKLLEHQGQKWIYFEMTSQAVDTDIYNIMLVTSFQGKMLLFNFNSTREEFPKVEAALRKSVQSITLKKE